MPNSTCIGESELAVYFLQGWQYRSKPLKIYRVTTIRVVEVFADVGGIETTTTRLAVRRHQPQPQKSWYAYTTHLYFRAAKNSLKLLEDVTTQVKVRNDKIIIITPSSLTGHGLGVFLFMLSVIELKAGAKEGNGSQIRAIDRLTRQRPRFSLRRIKRFFPMSPLVANQIGLVEESAWGE